MSAPLRLPQRSRYGRIRRIVPAAAALLISTGILTVLLWPTPVDRPLHGKLLRALTRLEELGLPGLSYAALEIYANVALFLPLGFLAALLLAPRRWWLALLLCTVLSGAAELAQELFLPERYGSARDVLLNGAGALIGVGLATLLRTGWRRTPGPS